MAKSLRQANIGVQDMADYLDVARNTVSTWTHDKISPSKQTLRLWAMRTAE
jgi:transcriptional regulator with XRE-family HTH domain